LLVWQNDPGQTCGFFLETRTPTSWTHT